MCNSKVSIQEFGRKIVVKIVGYLARSVFWCKIGMCLVQKSCLGPEFREEIGNFLSGFSIPRSQKFHLPCCFVCFPFECVIAMTPWIPLYYFWNIKILSYFMYTHESYNLRIFIFHNLYERIFETYFFFRGLVCLISSYTYGIIVPPNK